MTEQEYEYTTIRQDIRNLFTRKGMKNTWLFLTDMEAYDKQDPYLKKNYCTTCGHHEKHHQNKYHSDQEFCKKCWNEKDKLRPSGHKFNENQPALHRAIGQVLKDNTMIHTDKYRVYIYTTSIVKAELDNLESFFNFKVTSIEPLGNNSFGDSKFRIVAWTTTIFCRYCQSPFLTKSDRAEHEQQTSGIGSCYRRPAEVTFAENLE